MNSIEYYKRMLGSEFEKLHYLATIPDLLKNMKHFSERTAIEWEDGSKRYHQLLDDVAIARTVLADINLDIGTHVGMLMRNSYDFVCAFLAITSAGYVAVLIPPTSSHSIATGCVKQYDIKAVIYDNEFSAITQQFDIPKISSDKLSNATVGTPAVSIKKSAPAVILFSSGTSGNPKGALLSHGALLRGSLNGAMSKNHTFYMRYLLLLPLTHVFGLVRSMLSPLYTGSTVYINQNMKNLFADLQAAKPEIIVLVPALATMLCHFAEKQGVSCLGGKLKIIIAGGAPVPQSLVEKALPLGIEVLPGYGLTETSNLVSGNGFPLENPGSVGMPYPEEEVKIENGELLVCGDHLFTEYYNDPQATENAFSGKWFKTGDLAKIDKDGLLYITGRVKNIIVVPSGENISPEELEELLNELPSISDSLVYEGKNEYNQTVLVAELLPNKEALAAEPKNISKIIEKDIAMLNASLPAYKRIQKIVTRQEDFDRSPSMKIIRPSEKG